MSLAIATPALCAPTPGVYLGFGDSITKGFDDDTGTVTGGYEVYLEPLLPSGASVLNAGSTGEQTGAGLNRLPGRIDADQPQFALIMEGLNDILHGSSAAAVSFNLHRMALICESRGVIPILATILPDFMDPSRLPTIEAADAMIRADAGDATVIGLADAYAAMNDPGYFGGQHPNQAGYQKLASVWADAISRRGTTPPPLLPGGDVDGSGLVDGWDLILLGLAFGSSVGDPGFNPYADFNYDNVVDGNDLATLAANFGKRI